MSTKISVIALFLSIGILMITTPNLLLAADGYGMVDGKMMLFKDKQSVTLEAEATLSDGTKILPEGVIVKNSGKRVRLNNGMMIDMNGSITARNGAIMKDGKMMRIKDGDISPMTEDMVMTNGTQVKADGSVITRMKEGDTIMMDGTITSVKAKTKENKF